MRTAAVGRFVCRRGPAVLLAVGALLAARCVRAGDWNEFGLAPAPAPAVADTIVEPFFAFVLDRIEADSLGVWSGADVAALGTARGHRSRLPLDHLVTLERRRPSPGTERRHAGASVRAEWVITFDGPLDFPLPYSILGYHPGSLRVARSLVLAELAPLDLTLSWREQQQAVRHFVGAVRVFVFERGHVVMDADMVVDRLLGELLDDSWTVGFVTARDRTRCLGLGVMLGRDGRPIYGEFDFARDRIEAHGRPLAGALASTARRWLDPDHGLLPRPWVEN